LKLWLESKGLFYVCLHEKEKYCSVIHFRDRIPTDIEILTASVAALHVKKDDEKKTPSVNQSSVMNHERSIQWEKDESAVIYWLRRCCGNDLDIIEESNTSKKIWDALYQKYSQVRAGDLRQLEREITSFNREFQAPHLPSKSVLDTSIINPEKKLTAKKQPEEKAKYKTKSNPKLREKVKVTISPREKSKIKLDGTNEIKNPGALSTTSESDKIVIPLKIKTTLYPL
ncbi:hypothetical protein OnM2_n082037, partial [Erysiphe neolycopersici]